MADLLQPILSRKKLENARRRRHLGLCDPRLKSIAPVSQASAHLRRRPGALPSVIAEIKFRSPSAGQIRAWQAGSVVSIAESYVAAGASALSVLCDRVGFGGSPLHLRRVAEAVDVPVLFKEFVLDELQLDLARAVGASFVLLLVRALSPESLSVLVEAALSRGLEPVVEAANLAEVETALATSARVVGVNARDLSTFRIDRGLALEAVNAIPSDRIAVYMSGIGSAEDLAQVAQTRADAVLVGSALMQQPEPGCALARILGRDTGSRNSSVG